MMSRTIGLDFPVERSVKKAEEAPKKKKSEEEKAKDKAKDEAE